jgi:ATP/maltotriose-dependent transcriptional regulator MalT
MSWFEQALARQADAQPPVVASALHAAARVAFQSGDLDRAHARARQALELTTALADSRGRVEALRVLASVDLTRGDLGQATELAEHALLMCEEHGYKSAACGVLNTLTDIARASGDLERAAALAHRALALAEEVGAYLTPWIMQTLGDLALEQGNVCEAESTYLRALRLAAETDSTTNQAYCFAGLAAVAAASGDLERAAKLWGATEMLEELRGRPLLKLDRGFYEPYVLPAVQQSPAAFEEGLRLSLEDAVSCALAASAGALVDARRS